jgi:dihydrofolate reductase
MDLTAVVGDIPAEIRAIKEGEGGPILVAGSATLVGTLLSEGLVDELRLMVFPVMIGGGLKMFPEAREKISFELVDLVRYESGASLHIYRPLS